jgi:hypothetical protein
VVCMVVAFLGFKVHGFYQERFAEAL